MGGDVRLMLKVLYVDDDADIREIAEMSLRLDAELDVQTAASGEEALRLLANGRWHPDVLLLDVMMPGMDGPAVLANLASLTGDAPPRVIFVTARSREADVTKLTRYGAVGVVTKPFDPLSLAKQVRGLLAMSST